jgi:hypothetical protein
MEAGCAGAEIVLTASVCAALLPQLLSAVTITTPPEVEAVALIELAAEVPVQPPGSVHV